MVRSHRVAEHERDVVMGKTYARTGTFRERGRRG